jgi:MFS family permease
LTSTLEPLRHTTFRRIWAASLLCNGAQQIQVVVAAWIVLELTGAPEQVALVQTAMMLPMMLLALPGGALADLYDRRKAAIAALLLSFSGALIQSLLALTGRITAPLVLLCCLLIGTGFALFSPAWQSAVIELVGARSLPSAVALNSMSNSLARSVGPTIGGVAAATLGASVAFGLNVLLYVPMIVALLLWRRHYEAPVLPPEDLGRASFSGLRYAALSPPVRRVLVRAMVSALGTSCVYALLPLIAHTTLSGDAGTYGLLLGAFGIGAVTAAVATAPMRERFTPEASVRIYSCVQGAAMVVLALSPFALLSAVALFITGACWVANNATYNISIQMAVPGWVAGRMLAIFHASVAVGLGLGSSMWGYIASGASTQGALLIAGILLAMSACLGFFLRLPPRAESQARSVPETTSPQVRLDISGRSGAIVLQVAYRIPEDALPEFYRLMQQIRRSHERNGAYAVSLARDIADPLLWTESLRYRTWHDYVRARDRPTEAERELQSRVMSLHVGPEPAQVRCLVEQPYES